jgi:hypothetical protein
VVAMIDIVVPPGGKKSEYLLQHTLILKLLKDQIVENYNFYITVYSFWTISHGGGGRKKKGRLVLFLVAATMVHSHFWGFA